MEDSGLYGSRFRNVVPGDLLISNSGNIVKTEENDEYDKIGIYLTDSQAYTMAINKSYSELTEITEQECLGKHMKSLEDDGFINQSVTLLVLKHRMPVTIEQKILRAKKKIIATGNPIFDYHGNISMVITTDFPTTAQGISSPKRSGAETQTPVSCLFNAAIPGVIAASESMRKVLIRAATIANFDSTVLIQGETGSGKAVIAEFIHRMSPRKAYPFINVNMAAIPAELFESELFGYKAGSFTGALKTGKKGLIQAAEGGTIFLDEIGELSLSNQAKLLKLLQDKEVLPVGSVQSQNVNVRFISATNRNLQKMIQAGTFREDFFYRLNVAPIFVPPLRERKEDIFSIAQYLISEICSRYKIKKHFSTSAIQFLTDYNWPGNVRELQNVVERVILLNHQEEITGEHFMEELALKHQMIKSNIIPSLQINLQDKVDAFEKDILVQALKQYDCDLQKASVALGIHRTTLLRKLRKHNLK